MPGTIAYLIELTVFVFALWVLFFLSTLLHEIGHALGYMIATGNTRWHIRIGWGKCLMNAKALTVNLLPFDGFFSPLEKDAADTKVKRILMLSGGPAVSLLLVVLLFLLRSGDISLQSEVLAPGAVEFFIGIALSFNLCILILSVIPAHYFFGRIKGLESDGLQIVRVIRNKER